MSEQTALPEPTVPLEPTLPRRSGIVLHPTSLPGPRGIGQIGAAARTFAARMREMGFGVWQVLPLGPTSYGDSPYQCLSSFAANHLLIDLDDLVAEGLLDKEDLSAYPDFNPREIDYGQVFTVHNQLLQKMAAAFPSRAGEQHQRGLAEFREKNAFWLDDYCLFAAIKASLGGKAWTQWPQPLLRREKKALAVAAREHAEVIARHEILQYLFAYQWQCLRDVCKRHEIQLMGDIPIFVAHDSCDVWANPELFQLDELGMPEVIAGVPPDYFSETGQRWGNPLYRWDVMAKNDYAWWCRRLGTLLDQVDLVRIDHFRGFESYWEIDAAEETAINGRWVPGPGDALFEAFAKNFGTDAIIAEDLGEITEEVEALRDRHHLPGMKVLQFILGNEDVPVLPEAFPECSVCYTGTHDNDTTIGWFAQAEPQEIAAVKTHLDTDGTRIHEDFIRAALNSNSYIAMVLMQDLLGLGSEARLNLPGRPGGNWRWRFEMEQLSSEIVTETYRLNEQAGRIF